MYLFYYVTVSLPTYIIAV